MALRTSSGEGAEPFDLLSDHLLRDHLLRDHGRTAQEIDGLPLADLHRFEHVEQSMGLNDLGHHHPADGETDTRILVEPAEAPITAGVPA